jgi:hypothetical protein
MRPLPSSIPATVGWRADIFVRGTDTEMVQCSFELDQETGAIMLYDQSQNGTIEVSGGKWECERPRRVVLSTLNAATIEMGSSADFRVRFQLVWHVNPAEMIEKVKDYLETLPQTLEQPLESSASESVYQAVDAATKKLITVKILKRPESRKTGQEQSALPQFNDVSRPLSLL